MVIVSRDLFPGYFLPFGTTIHHHPFVTELANRLYENKSLHRDFQNQYQVHNRSFEIRHIGFLKVHKAGSTTMQNIFFRFGLKRNLTFVIPKLGNYFKDGEIEPVKDGGHYDILAVHSVYSKSQYDALLPAYKVNIGIVREPLDRMISAAYYYRDVHNISHLISIPRSNFITELLYHPENYEQGLFSETRNSMGKDFGFEPRTEDTHVNQILERLILLDQEFRLVLTTERFEESLVLMKRYLNWKMSDILFLRKNSYSYPKDNVNEKQREKHKRTCFLDYVIYDFFSKVLDYKITAEGPKFGEEVNQFKIVLEKTEMFCDPSKSLDDKLKVSATEWNEDIVISHIDCELMKTNEIEFLDSLRQRHRQMNNLS